MEYSDVELRRRIQYAVTEALNKSPATDTEIIDRLFVQLKPIVSEMNKAYTISELREMLIGIS